MLYCNYLSRLITDKQHAKYRSTKHVLASYELQQCLQYRSLLEQK